MQNNKRILLFKYSECCDMGGKYITRSWEYPDRKKELVETNNWIMTVGIENYEESIQEYIYYCPFCGKKLDD